MSRPLEEFQATWTTSYFFAAGGGCPQTRHFAKLALRFAAKHLRHLTKSDGDASAGLRTLGETGNVKTLSSLSLGEGGAMRVGTWGRFSAGTAKGEREK